MAFQTEWSQKLDIATSPTFVEGAGTRSKYKVLKTVPSIYAVFVEVAKSDSKTRTNKRRFM